MRKRVWAVLLTVAMCLVMAAAQADQVRIDHGQVTVLCEGLTPDSDYSFIVSKGETADQAMTGDMLIYADQIKSDPKGMFSITFIHAELPECSFFVGGNFPQGGESPKRIGSYSLSDQPAAFTRDLKVIGEEAFAGSAFRHVLLGQQVETIESGAFRNCADLRWISIPDSVTEIAEDAFDGCVNLTVECAADTAAYTYAAAHGFTVSIR